MKEIITFVTKSFIKMSSPYQKYFLFLLLLMTFFFTNAQTIEEEVAKKSCECIQTKLSAEGQITKAEVQNCISKSGDEVLKSKDPQEVKRITRNMMAFVERLKTVYKLVEKCLPTTDSK